MSNTEVIVIDEASFFSLAYWISNETVNNEEETLKLTNEDEFIKIVSLANQFWLIGAFTQGIKTKQCWQYLSEVSQQYLDDVSHVYKLRTESLVEEVSISVKCLNKTNIIPILLKGAATLFNGVSSPNYIRYMSDIDILVKPLELDNALRNLVDRGYLLDEENYDIDEFEHHHETPLKRADSCCYIEMHRWHLKKSLLSLLTNDEVWGEAENLRLSGGLLAKQLSPTHQIIMNIIHSELADRGYFEKAINLFQLTALYQLLAHYQKAIDWTAVIEHFERVGAKDVLFARLYAIEQLFKFIVPVDIERSKRTLFFNQCISKYLPSNKAGNIGSVLLGQLSEYSHLSIRISHNADTFWAIQYARIKVLSVQFRKIFSKGYIGKFYRANFS